MNDSEDDRWAAASDDDAWDCSNDNAWSTDDLLQLEEHGPQITGAPATSQLWDYPSPPLDFRAREIRLIHIEPALRQDQPLSIRLITTSLRNDLEYEALSYTWGEASMGQTIAVNQGSIFVRSNLAAALHRLRRTNKPRTMWIDALCINQLDDIERSHQVTLMAEIYRRSTVVLVWLGDSDESLAIEMVCTAIGCAGPCTRCAKEQMRASLLYAISKTFPRWWERVWIIQEVVIAASDPIFAFGSCTVSWEELESILNTCKTQLSALGLLAGLRFLITLKKRFDADKLDLLETFELTKDANATDTRDKIYSLRGLLSSNIREFIRPDYKAAYGSVFREVLTASAFQLQSLVPIAVFLPARKTINPDAVVVHAEAAASYTANLTDSSTTHNNDGYNSPQPIPLWVEYLCRQPQDQIRNYQRHLKW